MGKVVVVGMFVHMIRLRQLIGAGMGRGSSNVKSKGGVDTAIPLDRPSLGPSRLTAGTSDLCELMRYTLMEGARDCSVNDRCITTNRCFEVGMQKCEITCEVSGTMFWRENHQDHQEGWFIEERQGGRLTATTSAVCQLNTTISGEKFGDETVRATISSHISVSRQ
jgi:hypothetical protein